MQKKIKKTNAMRFLDGRADYQVISYDKDQGIDGISVAKQLGEDFSEVYKTLVLRGIRDKKIYVFMLPVDEELDLKKCAESVGEKSLEMVHVKELKDLTGYIRGGCSPIGMKKDYPLVIEEPKKDTITFSAGKVGYQIRMKTMDFLDIMKPKISNITQ